MRSSRRSVVATVAIGGHAVHVAVAAADPQLLLLIVHANVDDMLLLLMNWRPMRELCLMCDDVTVLVRLVSWSKRVCTVIVVGRHWWRWMLLLLVIAVAGAAVMDQHATASRLLLHLMILGVGNRIRMVAVWWMVMMMMGDGYGGAACVRGAIGGMHKCRCCCCVGGCRADVGIDAGAAV